MPLSYDKYNTNPSFGRIADFQKRNKVNKRGGRAIGYLKGLNLLPRRRILAGWKEHFNRRGMDASPLLQKFKGILNGLSWKNVRKIYDLHFKFRSARAQILADQSRLGVAATIKKSVDLYRGTLAELMGILVDKKISAKLAVCVIGSVARKEQVPQSDVDFVFIADKNLNKREIDKLRLLYRQTIDLLTVFGFPFEAATGIFDTAGRITGKKRDVKANQGVQVRSLQDISFLFGNEGIMLEYRDARLRKVYKNARENVAIIFDEMPVEVTSIKLALRFFSFTKHIASIHLRKRFGSTNSALRGLYEAGLLEKRELGRLRIILDRLLFLRLNLTLPDETLLSEERMKDYLSGISGETSPVRIAENRVFMGRNIDKNHVLKLIKRDVEYIEDFIERFRARLL